MSELREKNESGFGEGGSFNPNGRTDLERSGSTTLSGRKMSRIGPPPMRSSLTGGEDDYGKLLAMEEHNAIKYRTCSWQKVG